jgi:hypothetical protein
MVSGPVGLLGLMFLMSLYTPSLDIVMGSIVGWVLGPLSGMLVFASDVKADWNCLLSIFAFSDGFECRVPSLRRGAMPVFSFLWLFI